MQLRSNPKMSRLEGQINRVYDQESFHAYIAEHCRGEIAKKEAKLEIFRQEEVERFYFDYAGVEDKIVAMLAKDAALEKAPFDMFDDLFGKVGGDA